jgi:hypothetical protein
MRSAASLRARMAPVHVVSIVSPRAHRRIAVGEGLWSFAAAQLTLAEHRTRKPFDLGPQVVQREKLRPRLRVVFQPRCFA